MVSIPDRHTLRHQIQDLYGEGHNDQTLGDDFDAILEPIRKEYKAKVQFGSSLRNKKLATIVNNLYSETMEDEKLKYLLKKYNKLKKSPCILQLRATQKYETKKVAKAEQQVPFKLDNVSSNNVVQSNLVAGNIKQLYETRKKLQMTILF